MLRTLLALLLLAPPAFAQDAPRPIMAGTEAALLGVTVLAAAGGTALLLRASEWTDSPAPLLALPLPSVAATCAMGTALNLDGRCGVTAGRTLLWSLPGYALIGAGASVGTWDGLGFVLLGGLWLTVVPPFAAVESYRLSVAPAVVADPVNRHPRPGLHLRLGL